MLSATPSVTRLGLNRVTFGARDVDVDRVDAMGWENWVDEQLSPPAGDDTVTAGLLDAATYRIAYGGRMDAQFNYPAVDEERPLNTLKMTSSELFEIYDEVFRLRTLPQSEINRIYEESFIANWIRNVHSTFQVREFLADFWHRHFNVAQAEGAQVHFTLPIYDQQVLRANALGNFRDMVEANAKSTAMLFYLDNADSRSNIPNENYARELLELHTLGRPGYLGETPPTGLPADAIGVNSPGFTDLDILQASRALSGWTVAMGQRIGNRTLARTGAFVYEPSYHNPNAQNFLGVDLRQFQPSPLNDSNSAQAVEQGRKVIEFAAEHNKTGEFVVAKLANRIYGENYPTKVAAAALEMWNATKKSPNQIREVMRVFLLSPETRQMAATKLRRPYERALAFARTTNARVRPHRQMFTAFAGTRDVLYSWPSPDGWPDTSEYWLSTASVMTQWNFLLTSTGSGPFGATIRDESIKTGSTTVLVEDWINRMVGYKLSTSGYNALMNVANNSTGIRAYVGMGTASTTTQESELRRLLALIAISPEFSYR
jgi:uncharacterized protein (DUF1800 family)